jgi:hypothetical protein
MKEIRIAEVVENTINHCHGNAVMVYRAICGNIYNYVCYYFNIPLYPRRIKW